MSSQQTVVKAQSFIGVVTFYKSMCTCWLNILAPLHELTDTCKFNLSRYQTKAYLNIKTMITVNTIPFYSDLNKPYNIYTYIPI